MSGLCVTRPPLTRCALQFGLRWIRLVSRKRQKVLKLSKVRRQIESDRRQCKCTKFGADDKHSNRITSAFGSYCFLFCAERNYRSMEHLLLTKLSHAPLEWNRWRTAWLAHNSNWMNYYLRCLMRILRQQPATAMTIQKKKEKKTIPFTGDFYLFVRNKWTSFDGSDEHKSIGGILIGGTLP